MNAALTRLVSFFLSALLLASCAKSDGGSGANATGTGRGIVVDIDGDHEMVTIDHGEIGKLMQPIMMAYRVSNSKLLNDIAVRDSVEFTLEEKAPGDLYITAIHSINVHVRDSIVTDGTNVRIQGMDTLKKP